ncbi:hypothetical protein [Flaviaesturariibacter amylovorans]|uniref:Outer membrane protein beta-barrel domain-containing protein n=1 Tax=Flaviaesturariibacter amylovorans TaxID=1084520 RepID=A0ABP8HKV3_9BACT
MKKRSVLLFLLFVLCQQVSAQRKSLSLGTLFGSSLRQAGFGYGLSLEGYRSSRHGGAFSLSAGVLRLSDGGIKGDDRTTLLSLQFGYRQQFHRFYLQPRLGIGAMNGRIDIGGDWARSSVAAFFGTLETGYSPGRFQLGAFLQWTRGIEGSNAGTWHNRSLPFAGLRLAAYLAGR